MPDDTPPSLSIDEIRTLVDRATTIKGKALIWTLFETGARAEELLNVRLEHVTDKQTFYAVWIEYPKTYKRSIPVYEGAHHLRQWLQQHPSAENPGAQLFPTKYPALRMFLNRLGRRTLGKPVHPHLLRHSYATWLASKKVGRYQMCKLMGWAMSSDMPDRYIDRTGITEEETLQAIRGDQLTTIERENQELKNTLAHIQHQNKNQEKQQTRRDGFLNQLLGDPAVQAALATAIKKQGLGEALQQL